MASDLIEHVVKKTNARVQIRLACAVEVDGGRDLRFFGVAGDGGLAHGGAHRRIVAEAGIMLGF
jgi:hypothetical protein